MTNSTLEHLVLYMYNESNPSQKALIEKELEDNWTLREKLSVIKEAFDRLNKIKLQSPRKQSVDAILKYAGRSSKLSIQ
jgi:hypothetical protein